MTFRRRNGGLYASMTHNANNNSNTIDAVADTGCNTSFMHLNALSELLGASEEQVRDRLLMNPSGNKYNVLVASNAIVKAVPVLLHNIMLDDTLVPWFRCIIGLPEVVSKECMNCDSYLEITITNVPSRVLIGLDFLGMYEKCVLHDGVLECFNFDYDGYDRVIKSAINDTIKLYQVEGDDPFGMSTKQTKLTKLLRMAGGDLI